MGTTGTRNDGCRLANERFRTITEHQLLTAAWHDIAARPRQREEQRDALRAGGKDAPISEHWIVRHRAQLDEIGGRIGAIEVECALQGALEGQDG